MSHTVEEVRVLILDDEPDVCQVIEGLAKRAGSMARSTTEVGEFIQVLGNWKPSHIVVDLAMPERDGLDILRLLAEERQAAKIILVSGRGCRILDAAHRFASEHRLNIVGVLAKPFTSKQLRSLLELGGKPYKRQLLPSLQRNVDDLPITKQHLVDAILTNQLCVFYQPKVSCASGEISGFEALVRWEHPTDGLIVPDLFIPLAETFGLIDELTQSVVTQSLRWFVETGSTYGARQIAINISPLSLHLATFSTWMVDECRRFGISPDSVTLEITETSSIQNPIEALEYLTRLRLAGFHLAIDDFGVGHSSLIQLARLPFSELKIDKLFTMTAETSKESRAIARSTVRLAHQLGLQATAEGVETEWCMGFMRSINCDVAQGYWIGRPMGPDIAREWLRSWDPQKVRSSVGTHHE